MDFDTFWHKTLRRPYRLHVVDHGGGPVIIMLHGLAASSEDWNLLVPLLAPRYRCITIDLIGFGKSPKPQWYGYTMSDHVSAIHHTIRRLGLREPFILAGHSLGSLLATHYTRRYPGEIERLLLLSPPIYAPLDVITNKAARLRNRLLLRLYRLLRTHPRATPENFARLSRLLPLPKSISAHPETWIPFTRTLEHCIEQQTMLDDIVQLRLPIDIFYGSRDQVIIAPTIEALAAQPGVTIHKLNAPHDLTPRYAQTVLDVLSPRPTE